MLRGISLKLRAGSSEFFDFYVLVFFQGSAFTPDYNLINHRKTGDAVINQINNQKASG